MKWMQYTYVNGELKYEPKIRTADRMVELMAQLHFNRQAGCDVTVNAETDRNYNVTAYIVTRVMKDRTVVNRFEKMEEE